MNVHVLGAEYMGKGFHSSKLVGT